jgi:hypothetical protein
MKLTTPARASAPYWPTRHRDRLDALDGGRRNRVDVDDERGVRRLSAATVDEHEGPAGADTARLTLPIPSDAVGPAWMPWSNCVPSGTNCGIWLRTLSILIVLEFDSRSVSIVMMGLAASKSRRTIREPVTVISSSPVSCACAAPPPANSAEIVDASTVRLMHCAWSSLLPIIC